MEVQYSCSEFNKFLPVFPFIILSSCLEMYEKHPHFEFFSDIFATKMRLPVFNSSITKFKEVQHEKL